MNDSVQPSDGPLPLDQARELERVCDAFEHAWKSDHPPRIEEYLAKLPTIPPAHVLATLLSIELELRRDAGEVPQPDQYITRFPHDQELVKQAFEDEPQGRALALADTFTAKGTDTADFGFAEGDTSEATPDRIGRYEVRELLGGGGFGRVYLAHDPELDRLVAVKVPHRRLLGEAKHLEAFMQEARMAARLKHSSLVAVYDVHHEEDASYIVQEYVDGPSLSEWLTQSSATHRQIAETFMEIVSAVGFLHQNRIVHRDLKPANILLDRQGHAHVADFGLAVHESQQWNRAGEVAGTFYYMSPEQLRGETHLLDGQADIWSLGVIFYEMLVGDRPFDGDTPRQLCDRIRVADPRPIRQVIPDVPAALERICLKCLQRRRASRYLSAVELLDDLQHWLDSTDTAETPPVDHDPRPEVIPKGLRSFDASDANFFMDLLPGPRHRDGMPESVQVWKTRIESMEAGSTFSVGLLLGPSGCGKSSIVKAALLPRLSPAIATVFTEATPEGTEARLLAGLRRKLSLAESDRSLSEELRFLREDRALRDRKVLVVVDQFEQWLHAERAEIATSELVNALRHCDGARIQCLLLSRDDFWMPCYRFFEELDIELRQAENFDVVDKFDVRHAAKVLGMFGRAYGAYSGTPVEAEFVEKAVRELTDESGRVVCVHLALFAEMVKSLPWHPATLKAVGGSAGVGVTFLEESLIQTKIPQRRVYQRAACNVLKALLPEAGSNIRGNIRHYQELQQAAGYSGQQAAFAEVLQVLDGELRLVTPTDPTGPIAESDNETLDPMRQYYQLTHDYLVPSLRQWLTAKQKETKAGRATLKLEERAALWADKPESRNLPSLSEFAAIAALTDRSAWSRSQLAMMKRSGSFYALRSTVALLSFAAVLAAGVFVNGRVEQRNERRRAEDRVDTLLHAPIELVPATVEQLADFRAHAEPLLRESMANSSDFSPEGLRASLGLLPWDSSQSNYLLTRLLACPIQEFPVVCDALAAHVEAVHEQLWKTLDDGEASSLARVNAAMALAAYRSGDERWSEKHARYLSEKLVTVVHGSPAHVRAFRPIKSRLLPGLRESFGDPNEQRRNLSAAALADFLAGEPSELAHLATKATPVQHSILMNAIFQDPDGHNASKAVFQSVVRRQPTADLTSGERVQLGRDRAVAAVGSLLLDDAGPAMSVFDIVDDPESLTQFIHGAQARGVTTDHLLSALNDADSTMARYGLMLALGEFGWDDVRQSRRSSIKEKLLSWYASDPSSTIHGATGWLLRRWGFEDEVLAVDQTELAYDPGGERDWFVKKVAVPAVSSEEKPAELYFTFIVFQAGRYTLRAADAATADNELREVDLPYPVAICDRELTWGQLLQMPQTEPRFKNYNQNESTFEVTTDHPAAALTWYDSVMYCRWLTSHAAFGEKQQCYADPASLEDAEVDDQGANACLFLPAAPLHWPTYPERAGFRLPTEQELEVAIRSGTKTMFNFGEDQSLLQHYGWFLDNAGNRPQLGAQLRPNSRGLFDVHGGMNEWCDNWHILQQPKPTRAVRGGGWKNNAVNCRSGRRRGAYPSSPFMSGGMRLAINPAAP